MNMNKSRIQYEPTVEFVSEYNFIFYQTIIHHLSSFVEDGFLKNLFEKNLSVAKDKTQLLIEKFGEAANPMNFTSQAKATNIQPTTLSLTWENFATMKVLQMMD
ncbi:hypothetical protein RhiirA1_447923 [Rhizophagus irregularis]|uniref:Uncharacterized protein n=1 Tax=Rhizophagus irregularis TaxID=588596 RepID=A0A2N0SKR8_9GLOM|nr:hypothetical protein RhiirA1_447923 [Rhizophagus irregularis]